MNESPQHSPGRQQSEGTNWLGEPRRTQGAHLLLNRSKFPGSQACRSRWCKSWGAIMGLEFLFKTDQARTYAPPGSIVSGHGSYFYMKFSIKRLDPKRVLIYTYLAHLNEDATRKTGKITPPLPILRGNRWLFFQASRVKEVQQRLANIFPLGGRLLEQGLFVARAELRVRVQCVRPTEPHK